MNIPPYIKSGSTFRIISPAGKVDEKKIRDAANWLENLGYIVKFGKYVFETDNQYAGTDIQRFEDMQTAFDDPNTDVILCSRGGYGTVRIIEKLDLSEFLKKPKWMVGYSDITVLHSFLHNHGFASIHGTMPLFFLDNQGYATENLILLIETLSGKKPEYFFNTHDYNRKGKVNGRLVGGNLSILCSQIGTKNDIDTNGKILFIEDIDEYLYHIDRMMIQLKQSGKLKNLKGLVVGDFSEVKDNETPFGKSVYEIIKEAVAEYAFPVAFCFPAGHEKINRTLVLGLNWELDVKPENSSLSLL